MSQNSTSKSVRWADPVLIVIQHALIAFQENVSDSPSHTLDDSDSDCRSEKLNSLIVLKLIVLDVLNSGNIPLQLR